MRLIVVGLVVVALAACAPDVVLSGGASGGDGSSLTIPPEDAYIRGRVTSVSRTVPVTENCGPADPDGDGAVSSDDPPVCNPNPDHFGTILVVRDPAGPGEDKASVSVAKNVSIGRRGGDGAVREARFADIREGSTVSVWTNGMVLESYPVQVGATFVLIEG